MRARLEITPKHPSPLYEEIYKAIETRSELEPYLFTDKLNHHLLVKHAILHAISFGRSDILNLIFSNKNNSKYANFIYHMTDGDTIELDSDAPNYAQCPILYAVESKQWECALEIAETIKRFQLGNPKIKNSVFSVFKYERTPLLPKEYAFYMAVVNQQYDLVNCLLEAGVKINCIRFMRIAIEKQDSRLMQIGFKHHAQYDRNSQDNELFRSVWQSNHNESREVDYNSFIEGYKYISITGRFYKAMNMDDMVEKIKKVLKSEYSLNQKIEQADKIVSDFLESSAQSARKANNWDDFDWQTKVLGREEVWNMGKVRYNVLNNDHIKFIDNIHNERALAKQKKPGTPQHQAKEVVSPNTESPKPQTITNDKTIEENSIETFLCPITKEIMEEPMFCTLDGCTYEKSAITQWLNKNGRSFNSDVKLKANQTAENVLFENMAVKDAIAEYNERNPTSASAMKPI